jgi:hypothetical protein
MIELVSFCHNEKLGASAHADREFVEEAALTEHHWPLRFPVLNDPDLRVPLMPFRVGVP